MRTGTHYSSKDSQFVNSEECVRETFDWKMALSDMHYHIESSKLSAGKKRWLNQLIDSFVNGITASRNFCTPRSFSYFRVAYVLQMTFGEDIQTYDLMSKYRNLCFQHHCSLLDKGITPNEAKQRINLLLILLTEEGILRCSNAVDQAIVYALCELFVTKCFPYGMVHGKLKNGQTTGE